MNIVLPTLDEVCLRHGTDKASSFHDYASFYERWFARLRHEPVKLLEMGVLGGNSMRAWDEYFQHPEARFTGIELEAGYWRPDNDPRMVVLTGSQTDAALSANINDQFDIVIDDAGHFGEQQMQALRLYLPKVKSGGVYIIEDLHAGYWPEYNDHGKHRIVNSLLSIVDEINCHGQSKVGHRSDCMTEGWRKMIQCITFRKSVCVIEKA